MWQNQPYWEASSSNYRPIMPPRYGRPRPSPYGGYQQHLKPLNPFEPFEQLFPRPSVLETPFYDQKLYMDFAGPSKIDVRYKANSVAAEVSWSHPNALLGGQEYEYHVHIVGCTSTILERSPWQRNITLQMVPGQWYQVTVKLVTALKTVLAEGSVKFKAVLSRSEMLLLYDKAVRFVGSDMHRFEMLYRNKPMPYWEEMRRTTGYIMTTYQKDNNGHPASPINNEINGLFFSCNKVYGEIPITSIYGDVRLYVPAFKLLNNRDTLLYFCDFYCNYTVHYITLVATVRGSPTDLYCQKTLMQLNFLDNPFLCMRPNPMMECGWEFWCSSSIWIELLYTEDVDIRCGYLRKVIGKGQSRPNGLPNNKYCTICNLYPKVPTADELDQMKARQRTYDEPSLKRKRSLVSEESSDNKGATDESLKRLMDSSPSNATSSDALVQLFRGDLFLQYPKSEDISTNNVVNAWFDSQTVADAELRSVFEAVGHCVCCLVDSVCSGDEEEVDFSLPSPVSSGCNGPDTAPEEPDAKRLRAEKNEPLTKNAPPKNPTEVELSAQCCDAVDNSVLVVNSSELSAVFSSSPVENATDLNNSNSTVRSSVAETSLSSSVNHNDTSTDLPVCTTSDHSVSAQNTVVKDTTNTTADVIPVDAARKIADSNKTESKPASSTLCAAETSSGRKSSIGGGVDVIDFVDQDKGVFSQQPQVSLRTVSEIVAAMDDPFEREILGMDDKSNTLPSKVGEQEEIDLVLEEWILSGDISKLPQPGPVLPLGIKESKVCSGSSSNTGTHLSLPQQKQPVVVAQSTGSLTAGNTTPISATAQQTTPAIATIPKPKNCVSSTSARKGFLSPPTDAKAACSASVFTKVPAAEHALTSKCSTTATPSSSPSTVCSMKPTTSAPCPVKPVVTNNSATTTAFTCNSRPAAVKAVSYNSALSSNASYSGKPPHRPGSARQIPVITASRSNLIVLTASTEKTDNNYGRMHPHH